MFIVQAIGFIRNYSIRLERIWRDNHASLIWLVIGDEEKKFYEIDTKNIPPT